MILSGKELSDRLKLEMVEQVKEIRNNYGRVPNLAVILVGDNPASQTYVKNKTKACDYVGINNTTIIKPENTTEKELLDIIYDLNTNDSIDGILVQLPLPKHIDEKKIIDAINIEKDVDGFHSTNVANLWLNNDCTVPCTPKGIMKLLKETNIEIEGKHAVVIGRSNIVGLPISKLLLNTNATVTVCHSKTTNLKEIVKQADILVVAIGKPNFVTEDMVKNGCIIIDVGINRLSDGKLCGDVDFESVKDKASYITPVPKGVGPMTITCLIENTIECFLRSKK